jgi:hypothetical protein
MASGISISPTSNFAKEITSLFETLRPAFIVETGTHVGTGTTTIIANALRTFKILSAFYSIECNPVNVKLARANLTQSGLSPYVEILTGLSLPSSLLPSEADIERDYKTSAWPDGVVIDYYPETRAKQYHDESSFSNETDDLLGGVLALFNGRPCFILLDSAGHLGWLEFKYVLSKLTGQCYLALDDIYHCKHYKSFELIQTDPRFEVVASSREKYGFCIARFTP